MACKRAIVFDFDGTILDTETSLFRAWVSMYERYGAKLDEQIWGYFIGTTVTDTSPYQILRDQTEGLPDEAVIEAQIKDMYRELMKEEQLRPGVGALIEEAKRRNLELAVASSSPYEWVKRHLDEWHLTPYFGAIATADHVKQVKPDPALYRLALAQLGVEAGAAVAIEDSPNGALAAKRANMCCVIVPNPVTALLTFGEHDHRLDSLERFDFDVHVPNVSNE
ncbi:UNVERIFIED_CONTAM: putative hydrolase of the HAD superfamily [Brevibacillus sp. OAP136]